MILCGPYRQSKLDDAIDRGFDPYAEPDLPSPPLPEDDPWMVALRASTAEVEQLRADQAARDAVFEDVAR